MKKVLILYTEVGYGIKVTAENIFEILSQNPDFAVDLQSLQKLEQGVFVSALKKIYLMILEKIPLLWGFFYKYGWLAVYSFRKTIAAHKAAGVLRIIEEFRPDIIISTQAACTGVVAYLKAKKLFTGRLVAAFSDYHLHPFWLFEEVDRYFCSTPEQAALLEKRGLSSEKIALTGMIVSPKYFVSYSKQEARRNFHLSPDLLCVLISAGSRGLLNGYEILQELEKSSLPFQIVVVAGLNVELKEKIADKFAKTRHPVRVLGFVKNQEVLMSAADVLVTKPGGPTIAEAAIKGMPTILTGAHSGHEQANLLYLIKNGIAFDGKSPDRVRILVEKIIAGELKPDATARNQIISPPGKKDMVELLKNL